MSDTIIISGSMIPSQTDTLLDKRTKVATFADIANIENPARFLTITVEDTGRKYEVKKLTSKVIGGVEVPNAAIDINDPDALEDLGLAEEQRAEEEKVRQENEAARVAAETDRATAFGKLKMAMEETISNGNVAVAEANKVVDEYDNKVSEQDGKISEFIEDMTDKIKPNIYDGGRADSVYGGSYTIDCGTANQEN